MAYNGSGTYVRNFNWVNDANNAIPITASRMDSDSDGFAQALSSVIVKDGQQTATARIPLAQGVSVNQGSNSTPSISIIGDTATGFYQSSSAKMDWASNGTRAVSFSSAGIINTAIGAGTAAAGAFTTLTVSGNVAVNTNKFTVNASSGNTLVAGTFNVTGAATLASTLGVTGAITNTALTASQIVLTDGSKVLTSSLTLPNNTLATTQAATDNSTKVATTAFVKTLLSPTTNTIGADVALNNTSNYFDGPSMAQGTTGTWWADGTVTLIDTGAGANFNVKLWDGTTVIASATVGTPAANAITSCSLSGGIASPAGNIRISVKDTTNTTGKILFNQSGNSKDGTISAFRLA